MFVEYIYMSHLSVQLELKFEKSKAKIVLKSGGKKIIKTLPERTLH